MALDENGSRGSSFSIDYFATTNIEFSSTPTATRDYGPTITVIIGPNGSGKSRALAELADELEKVHSFSQQVPNGEKIEGRLKGVANRSSRLTYKQEGRSVEINRNGRSLHANVDGLEVEAKDIPVPSRVLAVAHLPWDRFRYSPSNDGDFYHYLGLRQSSNLTTTGALEASVLESFISARENTYFSHGISRWLALMGLDEQAYVSVVVYGSKFRNYPKVNDAEFVRDRVRTHDFRTSSRSEPNPDQSAERVNELLSLFEYLDSEDVLREMSSKGVTFKVETSLPNWKHSPRQLFKSLWAAKKYGFLSEVSLGLSRFNEVITFGDLSSGERQLLGTISRILANIRDNSVVLIDEPEVSLHPSWQALFIPTLIASIAAVKCHVIIATHSHFMVSDVRDEGMSVLIADSNSRRFELFEGSVYGRSPENILYRVFGMGASGNFFVEKDLVVALRMMSGVEETDISRLREIYGRLSRLASSDNPALERIVSGIASKIEVIR